MNQSREVHLSNPINDGACPFPLSKPVTNYAANTLN